MLKIELNPDSLENIFIEAGNLLRKAIDSTSKAEKDLLMYQVKGMLDAAFYMVDVEETEENDSESGN